MSIITKLSDNIKKLNKGNNKSNRNIYLIINIINTINIRWKYQIKVSQNVDGAKKQSINKSSINEPTSFTSKRFQNPIISIRSKLTKIIPFKLNALRKHANRKHEHKSTIIRSKLIEFTMWSINIILYLSIPIITIHRFSKWNSL